MILPLGKRIVLCYIDRICDAMIWICEKCQRVFVL